MSVAVLRAVALQAVLNVGHILMAQRVDAPRAGHLVQPHNGVLVASPAVRTQVGLGPLRGTKSPASP